MKRASLVFLQVVIVLIGIVALALIIRFPLTEGRAVNLDLFSIYSDPFIVYGYLASTPFFIGLYQVFTLLRYIGQNKVFSLRSIKTLRIIRHCAIAQAILIVMAVLYIVLSAKDEDPVGFISIGILATFISAVIASAASVFEGILQNGVDINSQND